MANLLADGFAMAIGAFLSSKSEKEYYQREWQREAWEVEHFPEGERIELYEVYRSHSYSEGIHVSSLISRPATHRDGLKR